MFPRRISWQQQAPIVPADTFHVLIDGTEVGSVLGTVFELSYTFPALGSYDVTVIARNTVGDTPSDVETVVFALASKPINIEIEPV